MPGLEPGTGWGGGGVAERVELGTVICSTPTGTQVQRPDSVYLLGTKTQKRRRRKRLEIRHREKIISGAGSYKKQEEVNSQEILERMWSECKTNLSGILP